MAASERKLTPEQVVTDVRRHIGYFSESPYKRLGDADSKHGVLFGELAELGSVAVKPFGDPGRAKGESSNLKRIAKAGFQTLEPLGVMSGELATYLITRRRRGLRHLGQTAWASNIASPHLRTVVEPTLHRVADSVAGWNNEGIFHGDLQAKNTAFDKFTLEAVLADAERVQFNPSGSNSTLLGDRDLSLFGKTVLSRDLLHDRSPSYRAGYLGYHLLGPYLDAITYTADMAPEDRRQIIEAQWVKSIHAGPPDWAAQQQ